MEINSPGVLFLLCTFVWSFSGFRRFFGAVYLLPQIGWNFTQTYTKKKQDFRWVDFHWVLCHTLEIRVISNSYNAPRCLGYLWLYLNIYETEWLKYWLLFTHSCCSISWAQFVQSTIQLTQDCFNLLAKERKPRKKIRGFNRIWTHDLRDTGAMLYQLSYEASLKAVEVRVQFIPVV